MENWGIRQDVSLVQYARNRTSYIAWCMIGVFVFLYAFSLLSWLNVNLGLIQWISKDMLIQQSENPLSTHYDVDLNNFLEKALNADEKNPRAHHWIGFANATSGSMKNAVLHWQAEGLTAAYFVDWGDQFLDFDDKGDALQWYETALAVNSDWSDAWYRIGEIRQSQKRWKLSIEAYKNAIRSNQFQNIGVSDAYTRLALIYQFVAEYKNVSEALNMYDAALLQNDFFSDRLHAEAYYKRGEIYRWQNRDPAKSIAEYEKALLIAPYHRWARLQLGRLLYKVNGDVESAESQIKTSLVNWPDEESKKWPYRYLGDIYRDAGLTDEAIAAYKTALQFDPFDTQIQNDLMQLCTETEYSGSWNNDNVCYSK